MAALTRSLGLLLFAGAVSADIDPNGGFQVVGPIASNPPYGIQASQYREAFADSTVGSTVNNVSLGDDKQWDVRVRVAANVSTDNDPAHSGQVTQVLGISLKPANGGSLGNSSICQLVYTEMKDDAESALLSKGSGHCRGILSDECIAALTENPGPRCRTNRLPDACNDDLGFAAVSTSFSSASLNDTGNIYTRFTEPEDEGSEKANEDSISLGEKGHVLVLRGRDDPSANQTVLCLAPVLKQDSGSDDGEDGDGGSGASSLSSSATSMTLLVAALVSMALASM